MQTIHLLDSNTVNAIAAGEVVERPASVVKELVENAIDANATAVTVEIKGGGIEMIRVTDNGSGIDKDDVEAAFQRHATSKIKTAADLLTIASLGFRGEALSSIAAVSSVEMITKTRRDIVGTRCVIEGGEMKTKEEIGCPDGTTIIVRQLFYNTPARRKFLKTAAAEAGSCADFIDRLALSRPDVSMRFINNGKNKLHTSGNCSLRDIIYQVYGRDVANHLLEIHSDTDLLHISGFIGKPILSRGNRSWENYFINGRFIRSNIVTTAIEDAYKTFTMVHKFPFTVLQLEIEPELIDVNVHPRKLEVKFSAGEAVYQQIFQAVRGTLQGRELIPSASFGSGEKKEQENGSGTAADKAPEPFEIQRMAQMGQAPPGRAHALNGSGSDFLAQEKAGYGGSHGVHSGGRTRGEFSKQTSYDNPKTLRNPVDSQVQSASSAHMQPAQDHAKKPAGSQMEFLSHELLSKSSKGQYRLIGQVFETYWLLEFDGKMYIMDQHAAHEKVLFERFRREYENREAAVQQLSPPVIVTLSGAEQSIYHKYEKYFKELCFEIEEFGGDEFAISGVPTTLFGLDAKDMFIEVLDSLSEESSSLEGSAVTWKIATMACKAAVKGSRKISPQEAQALIEELMDCKDPYNCPHGRPTIISVSKYELDKKFRRIQN